MHTVLAIAAAVAVLVAVMLALASRRPDTFHVERSIDIDAPPEKIFPLINDFQEWKAWTPYDKDPAMTTTYSGAASGPGARYAWQGNKQVGQGEITIRATAPPHSLVLDLHMIRPFEGRNVAAFQLQPQPGGTRVTWSLDDRHTLLHKTMSLFMNLDRMIGRDFEVGLSRLKAVVQAGAA